MQQIITIAISFVPFKIVIVIYLGTNNDYVSVKRMKKKADLLSRIDINPTILAGKPVIKGTRIPVYLILELLSAGYDFKKIINSYPSLKERDIRTAIEYAALTIKNEELAELGA